MEITYPTVSPGPDFDRWFTESDLTDCPACGERRAVHQDGAPLYCLSCTEVFTDRGEQAAGEPAS